MGLEQWEEEEAKKWELSDCPICESKECKGKELGPPTLRKYICDYCGTFAVDNETLRLKQNAIEKNRDALSKYIKKYTDTHKSILIIVYKESKMENYFTVEQMLNQ